MGASLEAWHDHLQAAQDAAAVLRELEPESVTDHIASMLGMQSWFAAAPPSSASAESAHSMQAVQIVMDEE